MILNECYFPSLGGRGLGAPAAALRLRDPVCRQRPLGPKTFPFKDPGGQMIAIWDAQNAPTRQHTGVGSSYF